MSEEELDELCARLKRYKLSSGYAWYTHKGAEAIESLRQQVAECRKQTLLEAAERCEEFESQAGFILWCKRMAKGE